VRCDYDAGTVCDKSFDSRQRGADASIICDLAVFQRNIEIAAKEYSLAGYIKVLKRH
jgi:hypothetical protein